MIGGLVARAIDPEILPRLGAGRPAIIITGTNGKSTTTRMVAAAVATAHPVATNTGGDNMDAGLISALLAHPQASHLVLEVDELHVPHVASALNPAVLVLLNLSRDQLDRVGEINKIERALRGAVAAHPEMTIIANCDDVLVTSVAYDAPNVVWVAAGASWHGDAISCPRTGGHIVHEDGHWYAAKLLADGRKFQRPQPQWTISHTAAGAQLHGPDGQYPLNLALPGRANLGNAAQAIAAAQAVGIDPGTAAAAAGSINDIAGRYATMTYGEHTIRLLLAKNPAGWQEALTMVDPHAAGLVIATNGQVADGVDMSWLWDVRFENLDLPVKAAGERATDLAVRLYYANIEHELIADPLAAIAACPPGRVDILANYTAFRDLKRALDRQLQHSTKEHSHG